MSETLYIIIIIASAITSLALLFEWRTALKDLKALRRTRELEERRTRDLAYLLENGWTVDTECLYRGDLRYWELIAPDENEPRILWQAADRQKKLDEIRKLNLPEMELWR